MADQHALEHLRYRRMSCTSYFDNEQPKGGARRQGGYVGLYHPVDLGWARLSQRLMQPLVIVEVEIPPRTSDGISPQLVSG
jgi:hypothetical protein